MPEITVRQVDFRQPADVAALVAMVDAYACDEMGSGDTLGPDICNQMALGLAQHPGALGWVAWLDDTPVGGVTAFWMYGTFAARPRINIHDLSVVEGYRDQGIGRRLLEAVEAHARATGCHAITLEVRYDNSRGRHLYWSQGFRGPTEWSPPETMAFWKKTLE
jgi:ribosomal protein S18 acetylase RimI-like enzyme